MVEDVIAYEVMFVMKHVLSVFTTLGGVVLCALFVL